MIGIRKENSGLSVWNQLSLFCYTVSRLNERLVPMRRRNINWGVIFIAFAVGLLLSCYCPAKFLIAVLAIAVILMGACSLKCR